MANKERGSLFYNFDREDCRRNKAMLISVKTNVLGLMQRVEEYRVSVESDASMKERLLKCFSSINFHIAGVRTRMPLLLAQQKGENGARKTLKKAAAAAIVRAAPAESAEDDSRVAENSAMSDLVDVREKLRAMKGFRK